MNTVGKTNLKPMSSFVTAPINGIKNAANSTVAAVNTAVNTAANSAVTVANAAKNTVQNVAANAASSAQNIFQSLSEPINQSYSASFENETSPFVSIPVILTLGVLIILFVIVVIFRDQITYGLEHAWHKIKELFGATTPAVQPPPPAFAIDQPNVDQKAVDKILPGKKEVFNVAQDKYTYSDAEPLCKAFGAELATYDQVKDAWQKGADWCNYGWIKGQSAVYPTQESTFNKLQAGPEDQRGACGMPGVNGGYFDNPEMRFGVNCYGARPSENDADVRHTMAHNDNMTQGALEYDRKVQGYKTQMSQIAVNPFKPDTWSS
jgi:hypothetical protein